MNDRVETTSPDDSLLFFAAFITMWVVVGFVVALLGGWQALSEHYACSGDRFIGKKWYMQSGAMRWTAHYGNVLTIGANSQELYLAVMFLFRAGHPPLCVPWRHVAVYKQRGWVFSYVVFDFKDVPGVHLTVSEKVGERIAREGGQSVIDGPPLTTPARP